MARLGSFSLSAILTAAALSGILSSAAYGADASVVQAGPAPGAPAPGARKNLLPWNDKSYEECGQSCLYQKANEHIALQATYLVTKIKTLEVEDEDTQRKNLVGFCLPSDQGSDCFDRYKKLEIFALYKMRAAYIQNSDSAGRLKKRAPTYAFEAPGGPPKKSQVPYVVTFEDLQKEYTQLRTLTGEDYQSWAASLPFQPSPDDFVKPTPLPRDPDNPKAGSFMVIPRGPDGKVLCDGKCQAAYQAAKQKYDAKMAAELQNVKGAANPQMPRSPDMNGIVADESRQAFNQARLPIIDAADRGLGKGKLRSTSEITFNPQERKPAAKVVPQVATGREQVVQAPLDPTRTQHFVDLDPDDFLKIIQDLEKP